MWHLIYQSLVKLFVLLSAEHLGPMINVIFCIGLNEVGLVQKSTGLSIPDIKLKIMGCY